MVLEIIWASAFTALAIFAASRVARAEKEDPDVLVSVGWGILGFACYAMALYLLNDILGAPLWAGLTQALPQPGTAIHYVTAAVICMALAGLGLLGIGWVGFKAHHAHGRLRGLKSVPKLQNKAV